MNRRQSPGFEVGSSSMSCGITSPSAVRRDLIMYKWTRAMIMWLRRRSPMRNIRQKVPSRDEITAWLENIRVSVRFLGRLSLANRTPP